MHARGAAVTTTLGALIVWGATPWLALALRGSLDDRARQGWRSEGRTAPVVPIPVPAPRVATHDERAVSRAR